MEIVDDRQTSRTRDAWEPERLLMEQLAMTVGYEIPVRGAALARLADRLRAAVPTAPVAPVSAPRGAGAE
jgi:hypothetical protein